MNQFYQKEYMSRQTKKVKIQYQNDTTSNFLVGFSDKSRQTDNKTLSAMETAILGKRNRLHYKAKDLQKLIQRNKVNRLVTTLIKKTRLNSIYRTPYQFEKTAPPERISNQDFKQKFRNVVNKAKQHKGIQFGNIGLIIWSITNIIQITIMVFIFCIMMAFPQTQDFSTFIYFRSMSIALYVIDMFLNFSVKRYENGKYLEEIGQISSHYLKHGFTIDLVSILIFPIDLLVTTKTNITILISFVALFKLVNNVSKFQKFEYLLINSTGKEHYYGLIKVFLTNFAIGHFLSILLNLMAGIDDSNNWQLKIGISQQEWYIKYIWGYYWGTNIMLTVGFGDICAQNYYEAILLVFIETFSCITLAYNINYVGALIGSIRSRNEQKKKKLKIFHRMCKENFVSNEMESKVACHIQEQYRIKQQFQFEAHDQVLKTLPRNLQTQFRKEANKTLFDNIGFLNNLSKKSLLKLAQIISRKICHPEEVVLGKGCISDFTILQKGYVTFSCRVRSNIDGAQIECIDIKQGQKPKILSLNFIKNKIVNYIIKSKSYSILYYLSREDVMESLRNSEMDFQMFCQLKDKDQNGLDENNLYLCTVCKNEYHNKFECSRLHFIPLKRKVILKYIHEVNKVKQHRQVGFHRNKRNFKPCRSRATLRNEQRRYIEQNFDDEHYLQIQNLLNFYNNLNFDPTHQFQSKCKRADFLTHTSNKSNSNMISLMNDKALVKLQQILENKNNKLIYNVWEFQIDQAQNFNFYFRQGNPDQLKKQKRSKRRGIFSY